MLFSWRNFGRISTKIASLAPEATGSTFDSRISLLEYVVEAWEKNKEIQVANGQHHVIIVMIYCITDTPSYSSYHEGGDSPGDDSDGGIMMVESHKVSCVTYCQNNRKRVSMMKVEGESLVALSPPSVKSFRECNLYSLS